jgi:hypothetical protein
MPYLTLRKSLIAYNGYDVGLGNRLRVTLGAKSLAEFEGREFYYVWPTGDRFGPRMSDLWHYQGRTLTRATSRLMARRWPYVDESLTWLDDAKRAERIWQLRTGSELVLPAGARPWDDELRELRPVDAIAAAVSSAFDQHLADAPYVGVMIRAHQVSHARTREASPVDWFIKRMHEIRRESPDVRFFVSCDVLDVQRRVLSEVPGSWAQPDKGGYNTTEGVRAAVVDLYLLASASHLIGPHFSSFVEMAVYLSGRRLGLETSTSAVTGPAIDLAAAGRVRDPLRPAERVAC